MREFYRLNHLHQTHEFVKGKKSEFLGFSRRQMTPWAELDYPNTLVNDAYPDTALPQTDHLIQTAKAVRPVFKEPASAAACGGETVLRRPAVQVPACKLGFFKF